LRLIFVWLGDNIKEFRDEIIRRTTLQGDNAAAAFAGAILTPSTWKLNPEAKRDEILNPFVAKK